MRTTYTITIEYGVEDDKLGDKIAELVQEGYAMAWNRTQARSNGVEAIFEHVEKKSG